MSRSLFGLSEDDRPEPGKRPRGPAADDEWQRAMLKGLDDVLRDASPGSPPGSSDPGAGSSPSSAPPLSAFPSEAEARGAGIDSGPSTSPPRAVETPPSEAQPRPVELRSVEDAAPTPSRDDFHANLDAKLTSELGPPTSHRSTPAPQMPPRLQVRRAAVIILTMVALAEGGCIAYRLFTGRSLLPSSPEPVAETQGDLGLHHALFPGP